MTRQLPFRSSTARLAVLGALLLALAAEGEAQRPFVSLDAFYQEETARRTFYDGFAAQADFAYRGEAGATVEARPLALAFRLDYALARQVDLAAVFDASGGLAGSLTSSPIRLSWIVVKPYWRYGFTDYAVRLAVDPATEGGFGFRQTDVAFVATTDLAPGLSSDLAIGYRRARAGFERIELEEGSPLDAVANLTWGGGATLAYASRPALVRSRAIGSEYHAMVGYRVWLDPAGSHAFVTLLGEVLDYDLISMRSEQGAGEGAATGALAPGTAEEGRLRSAAGRIRVGIELGRPSFIVAPYASLPVLRWAEVDGGSETRGPRLDHARLGLRFTLR